MTQEVLDDEDQMGQALVALRAERSEEPAPVAEAPATPEPVAQATPTPEVAKPAQQADPQEALKQVQAELHKARSEIGRVDALNRKYMLAAQEAAGLREELARARQVAPQQTQPSVQSKLEEVAAQVKDFPELSGIVSAVSDALKATDQKTEEVARRVAAQVVEPLEPLRREQTSRIQNEQKAAYDAAFATFNSTYPTAVQVVQSDDFKAWIHQQPGPVQYAFAKGQTPADAMAVLDTYDMHLRRSGLTSIAQFTQTQAGQSSAPVRNNPDRLQRAAGLPSRTSGSQGGVPPSDDFDSSLAYFRNKRLAAQRVAA